MQKKNAYNKYCIDCKKEQTTHVAIYLGTFICANCAELHKQFSQQKKLRCQIKAIAGEQWDDYQLKSIQVGGNESLFKILKEYQI
jgi:recombinational DNA repair protein (RecF pathway)